MTDQLRDGLTATLGISVTLGQELGGGGMSACSWLTTPRGSRGRGQNADSRSRRRVFEITYRRLRVLAWTTLVALSAMLVMVAI